MSMGLIVVLNVVLAARVFSILLSAAMLLPYRLRAEPCGGPPSCHEPSRRVPTQVRAESTDRRKRAGTEPAYSRS